MALKIKTQEDFIKQACGFFMAENDDETTAETLEQVMDENSTVWQPFENYNRSELCEHIEDMAFHMAALWNEAQAAALEVEGESQD